MKKLKKLNERPIPYCISYSNTYLEDLQNHKYFIFPILGGEKEIWKFVKTQKILKIEFNENKLRVFTTVKENSYLTNKSEVFTAESFEVAKIFCDNKNFGQEFDENKIRKDLSPNW